MCRISAVLALMAALLAPQLPSWEADNPLRPLPKAPRGIPIDLAALPDPPTPETVRLGRWLFFDARLSADGTISCGSCHVPQHAFSELTPVSTGIKGQKGTRKSPSFVNYARVEAPFFFWDGRARTLEEQALGPVANPIEMGSSHVAMIATLDRIAGYAPYFEAAFGSPGITTARVANALADYERTRMSGDSPFDRWQDGTDREGVSMDAKRGYQLFLNNGCPQCHAGPNFTDGRFHNLGIGWDAAAKSFADEGRYTVTRNEADRGAFKTPTLRDVARHPPYMHDGSVPNLMEVLHIYNQGGVKNPYRDQKLRRLSLSVTQMKQLVAFLESLNGEGFLDSPPRTFPQ